MTRPTATRLALAACLALAGPAFAQSKVRAREDPDRQLLDGRRHRPPRRAGRGGDGRHAAPGQPHGQHVRRLEDGRHAGQVAGPLALHAPEAGRHRRHARHPAGTEHGGEPAAPAGGEAQAARHVPGRQPRRPREAQGTAAALLGLQRDRAPRAAAHPRHGHRRPAGLREVLRRALRAGARRHQPPGPRDLAQREGQPAGAEGRLAPGRPCGLRRGRAAQPQVRDRRAAGFHGAPEPLRARRSEGLDQFVVERRAACARLFPLRDGRRRQRHGSLELERRAGGGTRPHGLPLPLADRPVGQGQGAPAGDDAAVRDPVRHLRAPPAARCCAASPTATS